MQPPSQDPTNQGDQSEQSSAYSTPDRTVPTRPLPGSTFPQNSGHERYPGEGSYYGVVPPSSSVNYPTPSYPTPDMKPDQPKRRNPLIIVVLVLLALVIILGATVIVVLRRPNPSPIVGPVSVATSQTATNQATPAPIATPIPTQATQPTPTTTSTSDEYSAAEPGSTCDTNSGIWTTQGLNQIQCGTTISSDSNSLGYLYLQLPNKAPFSATNKISVMGGGLGYDDGYVCLGLAEQGASTGVLGEFCGNGGWFIYSISATGVVTQTLNKGVTTERSSEEISLTLQGTTASFSIDTEMYDAPIPSIQPVKVAITSRNQTTNNSNTISVTNFSYMALTS